MVYAKPKWLSRLLQRLNSVSIYLIKLLRRGWRWYRSTYKNSRWYKKIAIIFATLVVLFIIFLGLVDMNFLWLFGKSPSLHAIKHPKQYEASIIYSADGKVLGRLYKENRINVPLDSIPKVMVDELIATEDERFYSHCGIDFAGTVAAVKDLIVHGEARGASTITQQLVKNMFKTRTEYSTGLTGYIPGVRLLIMKTKEWITAIKLEIFFSKREILEMYLNQVDFGSNSYGINTAASTYFDKHPIDLTTEECAVLVGMLKATTTYNPQLNPKNSLRRRNVVLNNLYTHGGISREQLDSLCEIPIRLHFKTPNAYSGPALYFRQAVADSIGKWCEDNGYNIYGDGLKIYTTLDSKMQAYAEEAVLKHMRQVQRNFAADWGSTNPWQDANHVEIKDFIEDIAQRTSRYKQLAEAFPYDPDSVNYYMNLPHPVTVFDYDTPDHTKTMTMSTMDSIRYMVRFMHCSFLAVEPATGEVKAWVGDIDFNHWKYDKVTTHRQPGSTFKLMVYTAAMENGLSPCDERLDQYKQYDAFDSNHNPIKWAPRNSDGVYRGIPITLRTAFARSINTIAVDLADELGNDEVIRTARNLGITSPLDDTPSLALGANDVTLYEMVNAYCTVVNDGRRNRPTLVTRIEDRNGKVIYEHKPENFKAIDYESAFLMQQMLMAGLREPGGTSQALWGYNIHNFDTDFGGKTGTTQNNSDGWYMGVTPHLVAGCWVGGEYRQVHFRSTRQGQGSHTALPVFGYFMEKVLADKKLAHRYRARFPQKPRTQMSRTWNCTTFFPPDSTEVDSTMVDSIPAADIVNPELTNEHPVDQPETVPIEENGELRR